jgi:eukaryotic-like serine/threonine-protein kinase
MEWVEGKDLREVWNRCVRVRHRIPLEVALLVAREVARSLSYVHTYGELNLVHRDVAPPNIMLAYNGDVKLTDFGLARSALKEEHTQPGVVFGRAAYLAPEQARGEVADPCTDVYSLAVVLWELLTGHQYLQIAGLDPAAALALVRHPKPTPPSSRAPWVTPALDNVVMRALAPDRAKRFQSAEEFRLALSEAIAEAAPRTDSARVSELMHAIYQKAMAEEAAERERFLKDVLPSFRAATTPRPLRVSPPPLPPSAEKPADKPSDKTPKPVVNGAGEARARSKSPVPGGSEAKQESKREAALKVLAELAAADQAETPRR